MMIATAPAITGRRRAITVTAIVTQILIMTADIIPIGAITIEAKGPKDRFGPFHCGKTEAAYPWPPPR